MPGNQHQKVTHQHQISQIITILSADVKGFYTNVGEMTAICWHDRHRFCLREFPYSYARILGYSVWHRRDYNTSGGDTVFCHKEIFLSEL